MRFPDLGADDVLAAVRARWDLDRPLPVPRGDWLVCPICRSARVQPRHWLFLHRGGTGHAVAWRCDVSFKCVSCSLVWTHGLAVPEALARRWRKRIGRPIGWREARALLEEV